MPETPDAAGKPLEIKKYPNRRYYDTTRSEHLTLEDIRDRVREGFDIRVTDSKTGGDITAQVLTQIVLELETAKIDSFPVALLVRMIRANDQLVKNFFDQYFSQAFGAYLEYQRQFEQRLREMHSTPGLFSPFAPWAQGMSPFVPPVGQSPAGKSAANQTSAQPQSEQQEVREIVVELRQQVASLQRELKQTKRKRARR